MSAEKTVNVADHSFPELINDIYQHRVIYIGETHDRYDHHLNQLSVLKGLNDRGVDFAIGLEIFQRPFQ